MKSTVFAFALVGLLALAAPGTVRADPPGHLYATVDVPSDIDGPKPVQKAILRAAIGRRWNIVKNGDHEITIRLVHRGYDATLTFAYDTKKIKIYSDSYAVKRNGERKGPKDPAGWIDNLEKDLTVFLNREAYL